MTSSNKIADFLDAIHLGKERPVNSVKSFSIEESSDESLMWISDKKIGLFKPGLKGTLITSEVAEIPYSEELTIIKVKNPRRAFQEVINNFFYKPHDLRIEPTAQISSLSIIGNNCYIGHNVVIEDNVQIGDNTVINHNSVIYSNSLIGSNCVIGANCSIGGIGFGYEKNDKGKYELINHIGNVIISDNCEIGNNTCIDKAVLGSTILEENVKVDNLVHIAHGCKIGRNSLIIANAMIAGSVNIGENVWIAPSASVLNQKAIGDNALVGMSAVVLKDVPSNDVVVGSPAKSIKKA